MAEIPRVAPAVGPLNEFFWTSGRDGRLRFLRCRKCDLFIHPPRPACIRCGSDLEPEPVSGRGEVYSFTLNRHAWAPTSTGEPPEPYVIAIVALDEQPDLRLTTNIVDCAPEDVVIGRRVSVRFEAYKDVWIPVFAPDPAPGDR